MWLWIWAAHKKILFSQGSRVFFYACYESEKASQKAGMRVTWKLSSMYFLVASVWKILTNFL